MAHGRDERVDVLRVHLEVDRIDVREALEEDALALHHRLGGERAQVSEPQDRRAVGDDGHHVGPRRVVVGEAGVLGDALHGHRDAGGIGEGEVALGAHRLGGHDLQLARPAPRVEVERFLVRAAARGGGLHAALRPLGGDLVLTAPRAARVLASPVRARRARDRRVRALGGLVASGPARLLRGRTRSVLAADPRVHARSSPVSARPGWWTAGITRACGSSPTPARVSPPLD